RIFLRERLYREARVVEMAERGKRIVRGLFGYFLERPQEMPDYFSARTAAEPGAFAVRDYVAGMTDRFAETTFRQVTGREP
ncbi:MAG TPA: deoxyguanosinetriphosphate triphosphohydrolase, partial [candidate division Zixibacteria bacterium]|nr:deoxyguanosinetriphosphate triphosphohydrolase [candidate division Zixibacteria bacterium]